MNAALHARPGHAFVALSGLCLALAFTLVGCTSMSGLSGSSDYGCKAPEGVTCDSVSGIYANAVHNNLPSQRARRPTAANASEGASVRSAPISAPAASAAAMAASADLTFPLRSSARVLRLWFKPWEDADRDLYDQGYVYVQIDAGQWLVDHAQRQIREAYAPLRPPPKSSKSSSTPSAGDAREPAPMPQRPVPLQRQTPEADSLLPPLGAPTDGTE